MSTESADGGTAYPVSIASIVPLNARAQEVIDMRDNRFLRRKISVTTISASPKFSSMRPRGTKCAALDFSTLVGRTCVVFGSARSSEVRFPAGGVIDRQHFYLRVLAEDHALSLTDTSNQGTLVKDAASSTYNLLQQATLAFDSDIVIQVGEMEFLIRPTLNVVSSRSLVSRKRMRSQIDDEVGTTVSPKRIRNDRRTMASKASRRQMLRRESGAEVVRLKQT